MSYVDAGYAISFTALLLYAVSLLARRRRWTRALRISERSGAPGDAGASSTPNHTPS